MKKIITDYIVVGEILSTMLHGDGERSPASSLCCTECSDDGIFIHCDNQSLKNLRLKKGESEFGEKSIYMCTKCEETYTSEEL